MVPTSIDEVEVHALHASRRVRDDYRGVLGNQIVQLDRDEGDYGGRFLVNFMFESRFGKGPSVRMKR